MNTITKNAIALSLRMLLVSVVSLFVSRIVLDALGVEDFGIYGVVGSLASLASFLNVSMAAATSRFLTFELGKNPSTINPQLSTVFSTSLFIHLCIAIFVILLGECVGVWYLNNCLDIPHSKLHDANIVFQCSLLSLLVSFTQVPYSALIMAHEKMSVYAFLEVVNSVLKLGIAFLILHSASHKLVLYAALMVAASVFVALLYRLYCVQKFPEARWCRSINLPMLKKMLSFSVYDIYGNLCVSAKYQGQPIILNLFFGVVANTAASIASGVSGAVASFANSVLSAFRPQITKQFAAGDLSALLSISCRAMIFSMSVSSALCIPIIIDAPSVLYLWLGQIPPLAVPFIRLLMLAQLFNVAIGVNNTIIHATGNIRNISFICGSFFLLCPIVSYFFLRLGFPAPSMYIIDAVAFLLVSLSSFLFIRFQIPAFNFRRYFSLFLFLFFKAVLFLFLTFLFARFLSIYLHVSSPLLHLLLISLFSILLIIPPVLLQARIRKRQVPDSHHSVD